MPKFTVKAKNKGTDQETELTVSGVATHAGFYVIPTEPVVVESVEAPKV